jgi:hypothetical protein
MSARKAESRRPTEPGVSVSAGSGHRPPAKPSLGLLVGTRRLLREEGIDPGPLEAEAQRLEAEGKTAILAALVGNANRLRRWHPS